MTPSDIYYRRNLPHYHPDGYPLFITFRLADSIPLTVLAELNIQREHELKSINKSGTTPARAEIEKSILIAMMMCWITVKSVHIGFN